MKDLHTHLLYGIDDGCKSLEEAITLIKKMRDAGTKEIIITPHYINHSKFQCNNHDKAKILDDLLNEVEKQKIDIKIYLGNEVFYTRHFLELLKKKEICTLNNSRYLLFEFPLNNYNQGLAENISKIISKGYVPVLAHPERYRVFLDTPDLIEEFLRMGVLMQGNYTSLFGKYGRGPKKLLKYYIKKGWISFLGSDTHRDYNCNLKRLERKLHHLNKNKDYIYDILEGNFDKVIENKDIAMIR